MHDDFLHRLRKEPRPEFAVRLQAQLRRQSVASLESGAPSRARTLITLFLLGGAAFALTALALKGFPTAWLELHRHSFVQLLGGRTTSPQRAAGGDAVRDGPGWYAGEYGSWDHPAVRGGSAHRAPSTTRALEPTTSVARSASGSSPAGGATAGLLAAQITIASSWSAYLYVRPIAERMNEPRGATGRPTGPQIGVFVRDSDDWPGPLCGNGAHAPDMAYAFESVGTVSSQPCPADASANERPVVVIPFGYEAVALARSPLYGALDLTRREVFLALAKWVPDPRGKTIHENTNITWRQIDAALGPEPIQFMGPPLSSAAGRSMIELLLEAGCKTIPWVAALESTDPDRYARICRTVRTDGVYSEVSPLNFYTLLAEPNTVGILALQGGQDSIDWQLKQLAVCRLDGVDPTLQSIQSGAYPGSRGLYIYIRRGRVMPNIVFSLLRGQLGYFRTDWALVTPSRPQAQAATSLALSGPP